MWTSYQPKIKQLIAEGKMEKSLILSVHPWAVEKIFNGEKTIEVRKTAPKIETPFKVYVYMTKHRWIFKLLPFLKNRFAKVIGSFVCDRVRLCIPFGLKGHLFSQEVYREMCLTKGQLDEYGGLKTLYGWHITEPKLFDKPRELREFSKFGYKYLGGCCVNYNCPNCIDNGWMQPPECKIDGCFLTHPPQSWCYIVEDKGETK